MTLNSCTFSTLRQSCKNKAITNSLATKNKNNMKTELIYPPHKYSLFPLFSDLPHKDWIFDSAPCKHDLYGYRMNAEGTIGNYTQLYECYIDTRYEARLRLFYYLHPERKPTGKSIYEDTEIGKSLPILNY